MQIIGRIFANILNFLYLCARFAQLSNLNTQHTKITLLVMKRLHYLLLICLVALSPVTYAGWNIPVTNFSVADYSAGTQNWQLIKT